MINERIQEHLGYVQTLWPAE